MTYETRTTKVVIVPKGEPLFNQEATEIEIVDEAAGEFVEVRQCSDQYDGKIGITVEEWPTIRKAIDDMLGRCRSLEEFK
jgi:hypothetical protein